MKAVRSVWVIFLIVSLWSCIGSSTETENCRGDQPDKSCSDFSLIAIGDSARGLLDAGLVIRPENFNPSDSSEIRRLDSELDKNIEHKDSVFTVSKLDTGRYTVAVVRNDTIFSLQTVSIVKKKSPLDQDTLKVKLDNIIQLKGQIRLSSGLKIDSGFVYIPGTDRLGLLDSLGYFNLGFVPRTEIQIGIRFIVEALPFDSAALYPKYCYTFSSDTLTTVRKLVDLNTITSDVIVDIIDLKQNPQCALPKMTIKEMDFE